MRVNPECMFSKYFRGTLFENDKRYAKSETTIQKALEERIPNHILHVRFERKTSVSKSNLCTHHMEYMYIITQNDRKCQNASKCLLRNGTESNDTSSYILIDHSNAFGLSGGNFFVEDKLTRAYLKWRKGRIFNYSPFWGPLHFDRTKLVHVQLGYGAYNIRS